jgi:selenocysteine lyase/cysteine desulfurase
MPDWVKLRDDFPITKKYTYLANAAIAPIPMPVYNEVLKFYKDILNHGQTSWDEWENKMEETRTLYAKLLVAVILILTRSASHKYFPVHTVLSMTWISTEVP